ncbi:MAG: hypothetical protein F4Z20_07885 [Gammaproteobacteria bacterium]|nr:hypothetical protein [Gammaproteobacteria bacterium]
MLIPAAAASAAVGIDQFAVPAGAALPGAGFAVRRIMQHGDLVYRAIDRAGFHANDIGNRPAPGFDFGDIERRQAAELKLVRLEALVKLAPVDVVNPGFDGAEPIGRLVEQFARHGAEFLGLAIEGLFMRPGNDRAGNRPVSDRQPGSLVDSGQPCAQFAFTHGQPVEQRLHRSVFNLPELPAHIRAVQLYLQIAQLETQFLVRYPHLNKRIVARDQPGLGRQHLKFNRWRGSYRVQRTAGADRLGTRGDKQNGNGWQEMLADHDCASRCWVDEYFGKPD